MLLLVPGILIKKRETILVMKNKILVLDTKGHLNQWDDVEQVDNMNCYKANSFVAKLFKRSSITVSLSLSDSFVKDFTMYDILVFPDTMVTNSLLKWLCKRKNHHQRIIILLRNKWETINNFSKELATGLGCELWSYIREDCDAYGFCYYNQFLNRKKFTIDETEPLYDVAFIGLAKDRGEIISRIKKDLDDNGFTTWFFVPGLDSLPDNQTVGGKQIVYSEYIEIIKRSRCIVDCVSGRD